MSSMSITGLPIVAPLQIKIPADDVPKSSSQQSADGMKSTQGSNTSVDKQEAEASSDLNTAADHPAAGARYKRGFGIPRFMRRPPKATIPSGTPGNFKPIVMPNTTSVSRAPNSSGVANFREIVFKSQHPGSSVTRPSPAVVAQPKTFGDIAGNLVAADRLVKAGVFKTDASLKTVTRDAFVSASVNGLVSTPLSIGTYAGSVWTGETIKGNFSANTPLLPPAHQPAPSQQSNGAGPVVNPAGEQDAETTKLRLDNAELKLLFAANTLQALAEGGESKALAKGSNWPIGTTERLDNVEKLYSAAEKNLEAIATENDFIFKPYKDDSMPGTKGVTARLDTIDKRNEVINKGIARLIAVREVEVKANEQIV